MMDTLLAMLFSTGAQTIVAGSFGGIARWLIVIILDRRMAVRQGIATILLGAIFGYFLSPYLNTQWLLGLAGMQSDAEKAPVLNAFILGLIVVGAAAFIIDWKFPGKKAVENVTPVPKPIDGESR